MNPIPEQLLPEYRRRAADFRPRFLQLQERFPEHPYLKWLAASGTPDLDSKIILLLPAFCDRDLPNTMRAALIQAANPERIRFAAYVQDDSGEQIRFVQNFPSCACLVCAPKESPGVAACMNRLQDLITDEDFVLHMDTHMRFAPFWDAAMTACWRECGDPRALLTAMCPDASPWQAEPLDSDLFLKNARTDQAAVTNFWYLRDGFPEHLTRNPAFRTDRNIPGACIIGHMMFNPALLDRQVRFDPDMHFHGNEFSMDLRCWTWGWNIYHPHVRCIWHIYGMRADGTGRSRRFGPVPVSSCGLPKTQSETLRARLLLDIASPEDRQRDSLGEYGPGPVRTLDQWKESAGFSKDMRTCRRYTLEGRFDRPWENRGLDICTVDRLSAPPKAGMVLPHEVLRNTPLPEPVSPEAVRLRTALAGALERMPDNEMLRRLAALERPDLRSEILVLIPALHPEQLPDTVRSARLQAAAPERLSFAVCCPRPDRETEDILCCTPGLALRLEDAPGGPGAALLQCLQELRGQRFLLRISEGTRFTPGWDAALTAQWAACGDPFAVLSERPDTLEVRAPDAPALAWGRSPGVAYPEHVRRLDTGRGILETRCTTAFRTDAPEPGIFLCHRAVFAPAEYALQVLPDPDLHTGTRDALESLRAWTAGFRIFHPEIHPLHILPSLPRPVPDPDRLRRERRRFRALLLDAVPGAGPWGLKTVRTRESWLSAAGLDLTDGSVRNWARNGRFFQKERDI